MRQGATARPVGAASRAAGAAARACALRMFNDAVAQTMDGGGRSGNVGQANNASAGMQQSGSSMTLTGTSKVEHNMECDQWQTIPLPLASLH